MPVLYNETFLVENGILEEWKEWIMEEYIPEVCKSGDFLHYRLSRMIAKEEADNGSSFAIQFLSPDKSTLQRFLAKELPRLQNLCLDKYGEKVLSYRSMMEVVAEGSGR